MAASILRQSPALRPFGLTFVPYAGMTRIRFSGLTRFASLSRLRHPNEFCGTIGGKEGDVKRGSDSPLAQGVGDLVGDGTDEVGEHRALLGGDEGFRRHAGHQQGAIET